MSAPAATDRPNDAATERARTEERQRDTGHDGTEGGTGDAADHTAGDEAGHGADGGTGADGVLHAGEGRDLTVVRGLPGGLVFDRAAQPACRLRAECP